MHGPEAAAPVFCLADGLDRSEVSPLCDGLARLLLDQPCCVVLCDVARVQQPTATTVDALARLQLTARRLGANVRLVNAGPELLGLLDLVGFGCLFPDRPP